MSLRDKTKTFKQISTYINWDLYEKLSSICEKEERTVSWKIKKLIEKYIGEQTQ